MTTLILDIETDNLPPMVGKVWVVCTKVVDTQEERSFKCAQTFKQYLREVQPDYLVGHNHLGFDMPTLGKLWGVDYSVGRQDTLMSKPCEFIDTKQLSQFLNPDRDCGHSLEDWGLYLGFHKTDYRKELIKLGALDPSAPKGFEFSFYHPLMDEYCAQDVRVTEKVLAKLLLEAKEY